MSDGGKSWVGDVEWTALACALITIAEVVSFGLPQGLVGMAMAAQLLVIFFLGRRLLRAFSCGPALWTRSRESWLYTMGATLVFGFACVVVIARVWVPLSSVRSYPIVASALLALVVAWRSGGKAWFVPPIPVMLLSGLARLAWFPLANRFEWAEASIVAVLSMLIVLAWGIARRKLSDERGQAPSIG